MRRRIWKKKNNLDIESWTIYRSKDILWKREVTSNIAQPNVKLKVQMLNLHIGLTNIKNLTQ